jgi:hypothetical protein
MRFEAAERFWGRSDPPGKADETFCGTVHSHLDGNLAATGGLPLLARVREGDQARERWALIVAAGEGWEAGYPADDWTDIRWRGWVTAPDGTFRVARVVAEEEDFELRRFYEAHTRRPDRRSNATLAEPQQGPPLRSTRSWSR